MQTTSQAVKTRVLVVDDSVVIRKLLTAVIDRESDMEVVGVAQNGSIALKKINQLSPDLITMDLDMPELDGLDTIREIRGSMGLKTPVIMVSAATYQGAEQTLDCLNAGADDFILKPKNVVSFEESIRLIRVELVPKIRALHTAEWEVVAPAPVPPVKSVEEKTIRPPSKIDALVIASSTGGPAALDVFFECLGNNLGVPVLLVQHMPAEFTRNLARRLDEKHALSFQEAADGMEIQADAVYVAPGGRHMELARYNHIVKITTNEKAPENFCRPAADVLFRSAAKVFGERIIAVVLTGMGRDGANGANLIAAGGGIVYAQDKESSVVWGMPGATVEMGCAKEVLAIPEITLRIREHLKGRSGCE